MILNKNPDVQVKFNSYPKKIIKKLLFLRTIILEVAEEIEDLEELEETLKWGEPSYLAKKGSTIRINWLVKNPNQYGIYFNCTSQLVPTFKAVFGATFKYEKNRAIIFDLSEEVPTHELRQCIRTALTYHMLKHKPLLGFKGV